jgi:hypothetical protein
LAVGIFICLYGAASALEFVSLSFQLLSLPVLRKRVQLCSRSAEFFFSRGSQCHYPFYASAALLFALAENIFPRHINAFLSVKIFFSLTLDKPRALC